MCKCFIRSIRVIDEITAEVVCPIHGRTTYYKTDSPVHPDDDPARWENSAQRMNRMRRTCFCSECGAKIVDYKTHDIRNRIKCDRCNSYESQEKDELYYINRKAASDKAIVARKNVPGGHRGRSWGL